MVNRLPAQTGTTPDADVSWPSLTRRGLMRTQVAIIGAGPAGLFLSHLLRRDGIDCVVLEARSRGYIEGRVRAGVLEQGTVDTMRELGLDARLRTDAMIDRALDIRFGDGLIHLDLPAL